MNAMAIMTPSKDNMDLFIILQFQTVVAEFCRNLASCSRQFDAGAVAIPVAMRVQDPDREKGTPCQ
jgi:hypothetical protein